MIIIRMTGGLGNQMFQYALYQKLKSIGKEVKFDDVSEYLLPNARPIQLWTFGLAYPVASKEEVNKITDGFMHPVHRIRRKLFGRKSKEYAEKDCNYDEQIERLEHSYLTGYFQSERYFEDIQEQVREAFSFDDAIFKRLSKEEMTTYTEYEKQIGETQAVSLHIRRGDYLENDGVYGGICTPEYYNEAIRLIKQKIKTPVFYVFSNDGDWTKQWCVTQKELHGEEFVPVVGFPEEMGYLDMKLMSLCKHHIIANSSFSWWGAWLNPCKAKLVIAPSKWFNNQDCRDIYTKEMIKISPKGTVVKNDAE